MGKITIKYRFRLLPKWIWAVMLFLGLSFYARAQETDCNRKVEMAETAFKAGDFENVVSLVEGCLSGNSISPELRFKIHHLLTKLYFYQDNLLLARKHLHLMVQLDPGYLPELRGEPSDFVGFFHQFRTSRLAFGVRLFGSINRANIYFQHGLNGVTNANGGEQDYSTYNPTANFGVALLAEIPIRGRLWFVPELGYCQKSIRYEDRTFPNDLLVYKENYNYFEAPLAFKVQLGPIRPITPTISFGGVLSWLQSSNATLTKGTLRSQPISMLPQRRRLDYAPTIGLGAGLRLGSTRLLLEFRYRQGLRNLALKSARFSNPNLIFGYLHIDDDFSISMIEFSTAYTFDFYSVKPKLKWRKHETN
ncbi:MAG: PorT family protein [Bacteroidia bacterium]|nr:PorT family protein [Bacteroidia bacterium]